MADSWDKEITRKRIRIGFSRRVMYMNDENFITAYCMPDTLYEVTNSILIKI